METRQDRSEARKKFTKPPVKLACLSCRASRIRCDGKNVCSNCADKGKECIYLPSRRGGPRKRKTVAPSASHQGPTSTIDPATSAIFNAIDVLSEQGRGVKEVATPLNVNEPFECIEAAPGSYSSQVHHMKHQKPSDLNICHPRVRLYGDEQGILNAYYVFIHNYYPVMPPPSHSIRVDAPLNFSIGASTQDQANSFIPYVPKSPASLAISAILALLPHPGDPEPFSAESVQLRKAYSNRFARNAMDRVEEEYEIAESNVNPATALQQQFAKPDRPPLHPFLPVELEILIALMILSVYEYAQRGNCTKMRVRAGEAYVLAVGMGLHKLGLETDVHTEGKRRAWWMTYYILSQCGVVSSSAQLVPLDPAFITPFPSFLSDPEAWSIFFESQQILMQATRFVNDQKAAFKSKYNLSDLCERMKRLDTVIESNLVHSQLPCRISAFRHHDSDPEIIAAQTMRQITQIKLHSAMIKTHRFRAFSDIPIFIKKHCDLDAADLDVQSNQPSIVANSPSTDNSARLSCCSSVDGLALKESSNGDTGSTTTTLPDILMETPADNPVVRFDEGGCAFSINESSQKCFLASLGISLLISSIPYPTPLSNNSVEGRGYACAPQDLICTQSRTMPLFCCCVMQSSYALLMLYYKYRVLDEPLSGDFEAPLSTESLKEDVRQALQRNVDALKNYSKAFEALDGMRDEVEGACLVAFAL